MFAEIEEISTNYINNIQISVMKAEIITKLDMDPCANANIYYNDNNNIYLKSNIQCI